MLKHTLPLVGHRKPSNDAKRYTRRPLVVVYYSVDFSFDYRAGEGPQCHCRGTGGTGNTVPGLCGLVAGCMFYLWFQGHFPSVLYSNSFFPFLAGGSLERGHWLLEMRPQGQV